MNEFPLPDTISRVRRPVKREGASRFLFLVLLSFAASVILTRWFLQLTGYPQVGNDTLHIAHVLWGGLLLFLASLLPLIIANRWVYTITGLLSGAGVGLFIDEVGKFITQNNDYFFPAAAPIIYAFFLMTVLVYLQVRRPPSRDARAELYRALDALQEVVDHDLDSIERIRLESQLKTIVAESPHPDLSRMAQSLLDFLASEELYTRTPTRGFLDRQRARLELLEERWVTRPIFKLGLILGFALVGTGAFITLFVLLAATASPLLLRDIMATLLAGNLVSASNVGWLLLRLSLEGVVGAMLLVAGGLLLLGRDRLATMIGGFGLVASLTTVNLLALYFDQFTAITATLVQFALLMALLRYRRRFLTS